MHRIKKILPKWIKPVIRFCYYKNERKKIAREISIRNQQNKLILTQYSPGIENLIVFVVDGIDWFTGTDKISGGILSIASIYDETIKLKHIHSSEVIMLTHEDTNLLFKHTQFPNNINVFRFNQLLQNFPNIKHLLFHVPEYIVPQFNRQLSKYKIKFSNIEQIHVNILNQNIKYMPNVEEIDLLKSLITSVSQTTAHEKYSTPEIEKKYGIPLYKLSVFASPERYKLIPFEKKENIIAVSPDPHFLKESILNKIKVELPHYKIKIIRNLKYMEYLKLISKCKFIITLGEGLDFYYIEGVFSGSVSNAIYKPEFFPDYFKDTPGVFENENIMLDKIVSFINYNDNVETYSKTNNLQFNLTQKVYKYHEYLENIQNFYNAIYNSK